MFLFLLLKIGNFQPGPSQSALLAPGCVLPLIISSDRWNICNMSLSIASRLHKFPLNVISLFLWTLVTLKITEILLCSQWMRQPLSCWKICKTVLGSHLWVHHRHFSFLKRGKSLFPQPSFQGCYRGGSCDLSHTTSFRILVCQLCLAAPLP